MENSKKITKILKQLENMKNKNQFNNSLINELSDEIDNIYSQYIPKYIPKYIPNDNNISLKMSIKDLEPFLKLQKSSNEVGGFIDIDEKNEF